MLANLRQWFKSNGSQLGYCKVEILLSLFYHILLNKKYFEVVIFTCPWPKFHSIFIMYLSNYYHFGLLICTLISHLRNQGLFQTQEKFHFLQTLIFFLKKSWVYTINLKKIQVATLKNSSGSENLDFFSVTTWKNLKCHPQNHFSGCRLKDWYNDKTWNVWQRQLFCLTIS